MACVTSVRRIGYAHQGQFCEPVHLPDGEQLVYESVRSDDSDADYPDAAGRHEEFCLVSRARKTAAIPGDRRPRSGALLCCNSTGDTDSEEWERQAVEKRSARCSHMMARVVLSDEQLAIVTSRAQGYQHTSARESCNERLHLRRSEQQSERSRENSSETGPTAPSIRKPPVAPKPGPGTLLKLKETRQPETTQRSQGRSRGLAFRAAPMETQGIVRTPVQQRNGQLETVGDNPAIHRAAGSPCVAHRRSTPSSSSSLAVGNSSNSSHAQGNVMHESLRRGRSTKSSSSEDRSVIQSPSPTSRAQTPPDSMLSTVKQQPKSSGSSTEHRRSRVVSSTQESQGAQIRATRRSGFPSGRHSTGSSTGTGAGDRCAPSLRSSQSASGRVNPCAGISEKAPDIPSAPRPRSRRLSTLGQSAQAVVSAHGLAKRTEGSTASHNGPTRKIIHTIAKTAISVMDDSVKRASSPASAEPTLPSNAVPGSLLMFNRARGLYQHWAVYIGDHKVVHLTGAEDQRRSSIRHVVSSVTVGSRTPVVQISALDDVLGRCSMVTVGDEHYGKVLGKPFPPQMVVQRALSQVGCRGYQLAVNNCEHFATWAKFGEGYSSQSDTHFKPLPLSCPADRSRAQCDEVTQSQLAVERQDWAMVFTQTTSTWTGCDRHSAEYSGPSIAESKRFPDHVLRSQQQATHGPDRTAPSGVGLVAANGKGWLWTSGEPDLSPDQKGADVDGWEIIPFTDSATAAIDITRQVVEDLQTRRRTPTKIVAQPHQIVMFHAPLRDQGRSHPGSVRFGAASSIASLQHMCRRNYIQRERRFIFSMAYFNGHWLILSRKDSSLEDQCVLASKKYPAAKIQQFWQQGYTIPTMAAGDHWIVVVDKSCNLDYSPPDQGGSQLIELVRPGGCLPVHRIHEYGRMGYKLTCATGN
ncbi:uncharacterized protein LOC135831018 [Sycon ciliatum]|uniref:uncharacterized protein LOC135831018 n=1 Tax=Sycon ciliatum TaxID=27933 RepID=UPI0031F6F24B